MSVEHCLREAIARLAQACDVEDTELLKAAITNARRAVELVLADVLRSIHRPPLPLCAACGGRGTIASAEAIEACENCRGEGVMRVAP
ncbi:MAG: hypothetical protein V3W41_22255 [Planctomycetota bacterium]